MYLKTTFGRYTYSKVRLGVKIQDENIILLHYIYDCNFQLIHHKYDRLLSGDREGLLKTR